MVRHLAVAALLVLAPTYAAAQQCTSDTQRVVDEIYGRILERSSDAASNMWSQQLRSGTTVREVVRQIAKSEEHLQLLARERNQSRAAHTMFRHLLGRPPQGDQLGPFEDFIRVNGLARGVDHMLSTPEYEENFGDWRVPGSQVAYCGGSAQQQRQGDRVWTAVPRAIGDDAFVAADRNRDGQITFVEFEGTREAFRNADRNRDNALSREEFGGAADITELNDDQFTQLDTNRNNRLEPSEWRGSEANFRVLDRNGNGWLSRGEVTSSRRRR